MISRTSGATPPSGWSPDKAKLTPSGKKYNFLKNETFCHLMLPSWANRLFLKSKCTGTNIILHLSLGHSLLSALLLCLSWPSSHIWAIGLQSSTLLLNSFSPLPPLAILYSCCTLSLEFLFCSHYLLALFFCFWPPPTSSGTVLDTLCCVGLNLWTSRRTSVKGDPPPRGPSI